MANDINYTMTKPTWRCSKCCATNAIVYQLPLPEGGGFSPCLVCLAEKLREMGIPEMVRIDGT